MKKVLCVIMIMLAAVCTAASGAEYSRSSIIYEGFENSLGDFIQSGADISYTDGVVGRAMQINNGFSYNSVKLKSKIGLNRKFRLSFYVKGIKNYEGKELTMIVGRTGMHTNSLGEEALKPHWRTYHYLNSEPLTDEWQKVSLVFEDISQMITDEVGNCVFYPVIYYEDKQNEAAPGINDSTTYAIDEFLVEPLDIIENGDFTAGIGKFTDYTGMNVNTSEENGNIRLVMNCFKETEEERKICYYPNVEEARRYRLSFRAKTSVGSNTLKTEFVRFDSDFPEGATLGTGHQELIEAELTNKWQTFSTEFTAPSETAAGTAYRYPKLIFSPVNSGTVYLDDVYIDELDEIHDIRADGEAVFGETINVSFSDLISGKAYEWKIIEPQAKKIIQFGTSYENSFSFVMPEYKKIAVLIKRINYDDTYSNAVIFEIDGIEKSDFSLIYESDMQEIGAAFTDTVWTPDFETVRAYINIKNKSMDISGFFAMYDDTGRLLRVQTYLLDEGINEFELPVSGGNSAKLFALDKNNKPLILNAEEIKLDTESEFIYVDSVSGKVTNNGTYTKPTKLNNAYNKILSRSIPDNKNVYIMIKDTGVPYTTPIEITKNTRSGNITYVGYGSEPGKKATVSGGTTVDNWEIFNSEQNIYRAKLEADNITNFRQLYINGNRGIRARSESIPKMIEITQTGYSFYDSYLPMLSNPENAEFVYHYQWTNSRCGIESITDNGDGTVTVDMDDYCWSLLSNKQHLVPIYGPAYVENAFELLDSEGEWFYDQNKKYLYYIPRSFEDMDTAEVIIPKEEKLVTLTGTANSRIKNISFKNIEFAYSNWIYPDTYGYSDAQSGRIRDGYDRIPSAAVTVKYADNVNFTDCSFKNLGMTGLVMLEGITNCRISGNEFAGLAGTGMYIGNVEDKENVSRYITIENNYIHDIGLDYKSCVGIATLWVKDTDVIHNEIFDVPYSAVHGGYGAATDITNLNYNYNFIHRALNDVIYDGGSLYHTQQTGGTEQNPNYMRGNYIKEQLNAAAPLYPDNGATGWMLCDNVIDLSMVNKWRQGDTLWLLSNPGEDNWADNNYTTTSNYCINDDLLTDAENDCGLVITNTKVYPNADWPKEAQKIIADAGISEKYSSLTVPKYQITKTESKELKILKGMTKKLYFYGEGGKSGVLENKNVIIQNNSPELFEINGNEIIAENAGTGSITAYSYSGEMLKKFDIRVEIYR